jgi:uncharacterized protein YutE (UPF0331/DUF86 family)
LPENDVLDAKLESLERCLNRVREHTPSSAHALSQDYDAQDIVSVNLQRAIQLCVDMGGHIISESGWPAPSNMADTFTTLAEHRLLDAELAERLRAAVGFRNISVHEYERIDWHRVYRLITEHLDDFRRFASQVVAS